MKVCVGANSVDDLARRQKQLAKQGPGGRRPSHVTRMFPRRAEEILDGGSLYWTIQNRFAVRQRIHALEPVTTADGISRCRIVLDRELVPVRPYPRRAFQGWRYLTVEDSPADLPTATGDGAELLGTLSELGLL
jgi:hypothetical protein